MRIKRWLILILIFAILMATFDYQPTAYYSSRGYYIGYSFHLNFYYLGIKLIVSEYSQQLTFYIGEDW
jgi:hypothetical protein